MPAETTTDVLGTLDRLADVAESFVGVCDELRWAKERGDAFADDSPLQHADAPHLLEAAAWDVITSITTGEPSERIGTHAQRLRRVVAIAREEAEDAS